MRRAGIAIAIMAGIGIVAGVYVLVKDVVFTRDDSGKLQASLTKVKEKDQLFAFAGRDIRQLEITVREVDYSEEDEDEEAVADEESPDDEDAGEQEGVTEKHLGLAQVAGEWVLTKPVHALASEGEAEGLANAVADMRVSGEYENVDPYQPQYGLSNPSVIVRIWPKKGDEIRLVMGKDTAIESNVYLAVDGRNTVYVASSSVKTSLTKDPKDLREKKVVQFEEDEVKRVILDHGGKRIVCEQEGTKEESEWWLTRPVRARADNFAVEDLVRDAKGVEAKEFIDEVKSLGTTGLDKPQLVARFDFGKGKEDAVISFGKETRKQIEDNDSYSPDDSSGSELKEFVYCQAKGRDEVFLVDADILDKLAKEAIDLRDRDIVDFQVTEVEKVSIKRKKGTSFDLHKAEAQWVIDKPEFASADMSKTEDFLWDLKDIEADDFLEDKDISLAKAGLVNPSIRVTLTIKDEERPLVISFGYKEKDGTRYYCMTNRMKKPVLIQDTFLNSIPDELDDLKEKEEEEEAEMESEVGSEEGDED
jgi:hypothetical protein